MPIANPIVMVLAHLERTDHYLGECLQRYHNRVALDNLKNVRERLGYIQKDILQAEKDIG